MIIRRKKRRNSEISFQELFPQPTMKGLTKTVMNYAHAVVCDI